MVSDVRSLPIRILDPEDESAPVMTGKKIVEQRGAGLADMQLSGWAWSKTCANRFSRLSLECVQDR